ncbi:MAG TPA: adenylate cyclase regulatory domain-containing protein [Solirubrobacteraceae bacterium]
MDYNEAGLLEGLDEHERAARVKLLDQLVAEGFGERELQDAVAEDRLALLPVERVLGGKYTAAEVEARTGVPAARLLRIRRLMGLPEATLDDRVFGDEDVAAAESTRLFLEAGLDEEAIVTISRVLGETMSRLTATTTAAFAAAFLEPGDTEEDVARRFSALTEQLVPAISPVLLSAYRAHLHEQVRRAVLSRAERESGRLAVEQEQAVCFVDLVGFTRLGGELEAQQLGSVVGTFSELAAEVTAPPVRLVKTIGDAAMLVSREPGPLVEAALRLIDAVQSADLPAVRAGIALGPTTFRAGDFYGHAVNLASRITGISRPGSVLCDEAVHDAAGEGFDWSFAGRHRLKGIGESVPLYRARPPRPRADDAGESGATKSTERRRRRRAAS